MEYVEYIRTNWPDIASLVTVISFIITILSLVPKRIANKKLEIAYFQFREIFLHTNRNKDKISISNEVTANYYSSLLIKRMLFTIQKNF